MTPVFGTSMRSATTLEAVTVPTVIFGVPERDVAVDAVPVTSPTKVPLNVVAVTTPEPIVTVPTLRLLKVPTPVELTLPVKFPATFPVNSPTNV